MIDYGVTTELKFAPLSIEDRRSAVDQTNIWSYFSNLVGNGKVVSQLSIYAYDALGKSDHVCPYNLAFYGPSSAGKTTFSRTFSRVLGLPHVEISPRAVKSAHDIVIEIANACKDFQTPSGEILRIFEYEPLKWQLPPCVVLLDEAHALNNNIVQALLKATERKDAVLTTEKGAIVDCQKVCWHLATTDRGELFDALDTRFVKLVMSLYTKTEIQQIIKLNYADWDDEVCRLVANYCNRMPREALEFARIIKLAHNYQPDSWEAVAKKVAELQGIDEYGMSCQRLAILRELGQGPLSINRMAIVAGVKEEELRKYILPFLLESTADQPAYITVSSRHYITNAGLAELDKRNISHKGEEVLA